jgi:hypothetical protein
MISPAEQIREAVAALCSNDPRDWSRGGREIIRITRLNGVSTQRLIETLCGLVGEDVADPQPATPGDDLVLPTMPSRTPLRNIISDAQRRKLVVTAEQVARSMKPHEHEIERSDARFAMVQAAAENLVADHWDRMNVPSRDLCQNLASWRGASISRAQVAWLRNCERAVKRRVA